MENDKKYELLKQELIKPKALPVSAHRKNPRNAMDNKIWKEISLKCRQRANSKCELCFTKYPIQKLHAHEMFVVNWDKETVTFNQIVSLCTKCHRIQHMGLAGIHADKGRLNIPAFNKHLKTKLKLDKTFDDLYEEFKEFFFVVEPWRVDWMQIQFNYIVKVNDFNEPLFTIWKEKEPDKFWEMAKRTKQPINEGEKHG